MLKTALNSVEPNEKQYWPKISLLVGTKTAQQCQIQFNTKFKTPTKSKKNTNQAVEYDFPINTKNSNKMFVPNGKNMKKLDNLVRAVDKNHQDDITTLTPIKKRLIKMEFDDQGESQYFLSLEDRQKEKQKPTEENKGQQQEVLLPKTKDYKYISSVLKYQKQSTKVDHTDISVLHDPNKPINLIEDAEIIKQLEKK